MFRFYQNKHQLEEESNYSFEFPRITSHDEENPLIDLFNVAIGPNLESNIFSFLTPRDLACFSSVNSHWHRDINQFVLKNEFSKFLFDLIQADARELANILRENFSRAPLSTTDNYLVELKNLYQNARTRTIAGVEHTEPNGEKFIKNWLANFHNAYFSNENTSLSVMPQHICNLAIIPMLFGILGIVGLYLYDLDEVKRYNATLDERDQVYQTIDQYLSEHIRNVNNQAAYNEYSDAQVYGKDISEITYNLLMIGSEESLNCSKKGNNFPTIERNKNSPYCAAYQWYIWTQTVTNFCYENDNQPIPFSYVENTPELNSLIQRCTTLNQNLGLINDGNSYDSYYVNHRIPYSDTPYATVRNWEWAPITGFILLLLLWIARSGMFRAISNISTNRAGSEFFSRTKKSAHESKNLLDWEIRIEQQREGKKRDERKSFER